MIPPVGLQDGDRGGKAVSENVPYNSVNVPVFRNAPLYGSLAVSGGFIYGMTGAGGTGSAGTIYRMALDGTAFTVLHSFNFGDPNDGNGPDGGVTVVGSNLYGMAAGGGAGDNGIIFRIGTDGTAFTILHSFAGSPTDGNGPQGNGLVLDASGTTLVDMVRSVSASCACA